MAADQQFMMLAKQGAKIFSTCGKRQYMCILTDENDYIVGMGYNGGPSGIPHCVDGGCPRFQENSPPGSNYDNCIAIHAEQNAFLHSDHSKARNLYVNGPPCFTCAKLIANSSVSDVHFIVDASYTEFEQSRVIMMDSGINLWAYDQDLTSQELERTSFGKRLRRASR